MVQSANMNVMIATARKAGRALAKDFREVANLQVSVTGASDFVARADMHADKVVREELLAARPTYGYLAAESAEIEGQRSDPSLDRGCHGRCHQLPTRHASLCGHDCFAA